MSLLTCEPVSFVPQYTGYMLQQCVEWPEALENSSVRWQTICGCCGLDHEGSSDASEEPGAVCLVFGGFDHGFPRKCLVHSHRQRDLARKTSSYVAIAKDTCRVIGLRTQVRTTKDIQANEADVLGDRFGMFVE